MVNAVTVDSSGNCTSLKVTTKKKDFFLKDSRLHIHYKDEGFIILNTSSIDDLLSDSTKLFDFSLPPPLNMYIYPENIIVMKLNMEKTCDLSCEEFLEYCTKFKADMIDIKNYLAIYDVPLDQNIYENEEESEEEDEEYEDSDEEEDNIEDEDWEVDDDDTTVN